MSGPSRVVNPGWDDRTKVGSYWSEETPPLNDKAQQVLGEYSGLPREEWVAHANKIREQAWVCAPYPCVGMWTFLQFAISAMADYTEAVERLKHGQKLLDLGGGLGQDLRALTADGAPSESLTEIDHDQSLWQIGYDFFLDRQSFEAKFVKGDIRDRAQFASLNGTFDLIFVGQIIHLFDVDEQKDVVETVLDLLCPVEDSLIFGFQVGGCGEPRMLKGPKGKTYRHSTQSIQDLWKEAAAARGFEVVTAAELLSAPSNITNLVDEGGEPLLRLHWSVRIRKVCTRQK